MQVLCQTRALRGCPTACGLSPRGWLGGVGSRGAASCFRVFPRVPFWEASYRVFRSLRPCSCRIQLAVNSYPEYSHHKCCCFNVQKFSLDLKTSLPCLSLTCPVFPAASGPGGGHSCAELLLSSHSVIWPFWGPFQSMA